MKFSTFALPLTLCAASLLSTAAQAQVRITEWMYKGSAEFVEFTNIGTTAIDFSGWSFDDDSRIPGVLDLSGFGTVAAGESVLITEADANEFRIRWDLAASVKVIGEYTNNLGNGDEINLFDGSGTLVDRLTYGTSPKTDVGSGRPTTASALGANDVSLWVLSSVGDLEGSYLSLAGDIGSPGQTSFITSVPEPETYAMLLGGLGLVGWMARRRRA